MRVRWSEIASEDIRDIFYFLSIDDEAAAADAVKKIVLSTDRSAASPNMGRPGKTKERNPFFTDAEDNKPEPRPRANAHSSVASATQRKSRASGDNVARKTAFPYSGNHGSAFRPRPASQDRPTGQRNRTCARQAACRC